MKLSAVKPNSQTANRSALRVPLTITLAPKSYRFVEDCAQMKEFRSVDDLFEAALTFYQRQTRALRAYTEMQMDKGYSREEVLQSVQLEFVFTKLKEQTRLRSE
jgi:protein tyrosine phosphatase (PTP) superfamily phosphohydrolase (DUF442 family)